LKTSARRPQKARQIWLAWLCALSLLAFHGIGHWHRIAHADGQNTVGPVDKAADWGHQSGGADCKLFDQVSHDLGPGRSANIACAAPVQLATADIVNIRLDSAARWKRGARGPPISL